MSIANSERIRMHSSRMRTARSLTVSRRIPCTPPCNHACPSTIPPSPQPCMPPHNHACPPATMHVPLQPCTPPCNHAHPLQPHIPPTTTHTPHNHACPLQLHMPPNHAPPGTTHTPQPCTPPKATHPPATTLTPACGQNHRRLWKYNLAPTSLRAVIKQKYRCKKAS